MPDTQPGITIPQALVGLIISMIMTIGTAYMTLREGDVSRNAKLEEHDRRLNKIERNQEMTDLRYIQILQKLAEIQIELKDKKDREK